MNEEIREQKESIKLTKNAKGEYQWEIKVIPEDLTPILKDKDIKRLKQLDEDLNKAYGSKK